MSEHSAFEEKMLTGMTEVRTLLKAAVGEDGNGGRMAEMRRDHDFLKDRVRIIEDDHAGRKNWLTNLISAVGGGVLTALADRFIRR